MRRAFYFEIPWWLCKIDLIFRVNSPGDECQGKIRDKESKYLLYLNIKSSECSKYYFETQELVTTERLFKKIKILAKKPFPKSLVPGVINFKTSVPPTPPNYYAIPLYDLGSHDPLSENQLIIIRTWKRKSIMPTPSSNGNNGDRIITIQDWRFGAQHHTKNSTHISFWWLLTMPSLTFLYRAGFSSTIIDSNFVAIFTHMIGIQAGIVSSQFLYLVNNNAISWHSIWGWTNSRKPLIGRESSLSG